MMRSLSQETCPTSSELDSFAVESLSSSLPRRKVRQNIFCVEINTIILLYRSELLTPLFFNVFLVEQ